MNLIVKHRVKTEDSVDHWFVRGITDSGKFHGEIRREVANVHRPLKWSGEFESDESAEIQEIATRLLEDFESPDLSETGAWNTSIFSGKIGSGKYRQLALINVEGKYFPEGSADLVDKLIEILLPYASEEFLTAMGSG